MDPISIILTIAACIGGLFLLYFILALIVATIGIRKAKKWAEEESGSFTFPGSNFRR